MKIEIVTLKVRTIGHQVKVSNIPTASSNNKSTIVIAGDSIIKDIKGWLMNRNKRVKISSFPGANTEDMKDFVTPLLRKRPDELILHIGTNNLQEESPNKIASDIILGLLNE